MTSEYKSFAECQDPRTAAGEFYFTLTITVETSCVGKLVQQCSFVNICTTSVQHSDLGRQTGQQKLFDPQFGTVRGKSGVCAALAYLVAEFLELKHGKQSSDSARRSLRLAATSLANHQAFDKERCQYKKTVKDRMIPSVAALFSEGQDLMATTY